LSAAVATKPRAKSAKAAPLELVRPECEIAGQKVLTGITEAIAILVALAQTPNECVTPAERAAADLSPIVSKRLLPPVFTFLEKAPITNERADEAQRMLEDAAAILDTLSAITVGSPFAGPALEAFIMVDGAMEWLRDSSPWSGAPSLPVAARSSAGKSTRRPSISDGWFAPAKTARDDISELLYTAYEIEQDRPGNDDAGWLLDMAADKLGTFDMAADSDQEAFENAVYQTIALIKGVKHIPGAGMSVSALALVDQAFAKLEALAGFLCGSRAHAQ
jgi:hypothetical protein